MMPTPRTAITDKTFSDEQIEQLAYDLNFSIDDYLYDEIRRGLMDELGAAQSYTFESLSSEKLLKAMAKVVNNLKNNPNHYSKPDSETFAHVLTGKQQLPAGVTRAFESKLDKMIEEELMNEGFSDFVKKIKSGSQEAWNSVVGAFSKAVASMKGAISKKAAQFNNAKAYLEKWKNIVAQAEKETGQKFPIDDTIKIAMGLEAKAKEAAQEIASDKAQLPKQQTAAESFVRSNTRTINESTVKAIQNQKKPLNESITATTIVGFILATIGGIPMLLKGLYIISKKYNFHKCSEAFHHAYHVAHQIEKKTVDIIIPDKLSYAVYTKIWKLGYRPKESTNSDEMLPFDQFTADKDGVRHHVEETIYRLMLTYFFVVGCTAVLNAGLSFLSAAEAGATTVKAIEIAKTVTTAVETLAPGAITAAKAIVTKGKMG